MSNLFVRANHRNTVTHHMELNMEIFNVSRETVNHLEETVFCGHHIIEYLRSLIVASTY